MQRFTGMEYMKIDIADNYGLDKKTWNERIEWVNQNEKDLEKFTEEADSPCLYWASVDAYRKAQKGESINYGISLDATCSGTQWMSVLTDDRTGAVLTNVLPNKRNQRMDMYTYVYKKFCKATGENEYITRDVVKKAIMICAYGGVTEPKELFGDLYEMFCEVMANEVPNVWQVGNYMADNWRNDVDCLRWILPDNFHVNCTVKCKDVEEFEFMGQKRQFIHETIRPSSHGRSIAANTIHSIDSLAAREICALAMHNPGRIKWIKSYLNQKGNSKGDTKKRNKEMVKILLDHYEKSGFLSVRIFDYLDAESILLVPEKELKELLYLVPEKPFNVLCVHDCFRVHPNYGNDIRWLYITTLSRVSRSNLLQYVLRQIYEDGSIVINRSQPHMWEEILDSEYALS